MTLVCPCGYVPVCTRVPVLSSTGGLVPFHNRFKDLFTFNCVSVCLVLKPEEARGAQLPGAVCQWW